MAASVGAGQVWIRIDGVPDGPITVDARVGFGNIDINANTDVAVEVRTEIDSGDARLYGQTQTDDVMRLGPNRDPDVIVLARVGVGQVNLSGYEMTPTPPQGETPLLGNGPFDPLVEAHSTGTQVTDGVGVSTDGWIVIAYGEALIDPNNEVVVGDVDPPTRPVYTQMGPFFVADGIITTPGGETFGPQRPPPAIQHCVTTPGHRARVARAASAAEHDHRIIHYGGPRTNQHHHRRLT